MRNKDNLTHKEWIFCEAMLRNGMVVESAYNEAYHNDKCGRNGHRLLTRKEVVVYLNKRLQEKQATLDILIEGALSKLKEHKDSPIDDTSLEATKQILAYATKQEELKSRLKELEVPKSPNQPIVINVGSATKDV